MIRHISIYTLKQGTDVARIGELVDALRERIPGPIASAYGPDAGLRPGNGGFGLSFDFPDEAAYRSWDTHPEHERIRRELLPLVAGIQRCQFRV